MNARTLAFTRAALAVAVAITGFIIQHSAKITNLAVVLHAAALKAAAKAAEVKVEKAWSNYDALKVQAALVAEAKYTAYRAVEDSYDTRALTLTAVNAELSLIGAA